MEQLNKQHNEVFVLNAWVVYVKLLGKVRFIFITLTYNRSKCNVKLKETSYWTVLIYLTLFPHLFNFAITKSTLVLWVCHIGWYRLPLREGYNWFQWGLESECKVETSAYYHTNKLELESSTWEINQNLHKLPCARTWTEGPKTGLRPTASRGLTILAWLLHSVSKILIKDCGAHWAKWCFIWNCVSNYN